MAEKITLEEALRENKELKAKIAELTEMVNYLQKQLFGKKTEKLSAGQLDLFDDKEQETAPTNDSTVEKLTTTVTSHQRKCKSKESRKEWLDCLEQVEELHQLSKQELTCDQCGQMMTVIGKHEQYREVKLVPAHLCCKIVCTETARCEHCQDPETGNDVLVQAKTPQPLFPHSYLSSSVIAEVLFEKFGLAVPFTRQTQYWERLGLPITSKHMARGVIEAGERFGQKIYERLRQEIKAAPVVQLDETPFQVLDLDQSHGYFWSACSTEEFSPHQVSYFHYAPSRSGKVITEILGNDFSGGIMCDGFSGYSDNRLPEAYWGTCLVHINRQFKRLLDPKITRFQGQSIASDAVRILAKVFHIEKRLKYSSASEKAAQRRQHLKAMIDDFYQLIEEALTKSPLKPLRNAIKNALKLKKRVYQMFRHGELPLHNNYNEQLIRPTTLVRKNSLFAKSTAGAKANAIWYSIVQTAKLNHLDVFKYLETLLSAFTKRETPEIEAYLPWAREIQESCKA